MKKDSSLGPALGMLALFLIFGILIGSELIKEKTDTSHGQSESATLSQAEESSTEALSMDASSVETPSTEIQDDMTEDQIDYSSDDEVGELSEATTESKVVRNQGKLSRNGTSKGNKIISGDSDTKGTTPQTSATTEFDPDDHDIEGYYEDNRDEFDSIDDAYDAFEDDEDAWDDY